VFPVLLIHGGADTYNPTAMAHELHAAQPHADLWIVPRADHVMSYFTAPGAYRKRVEQFLERLKEESERRADTNLPAFGRSRSAMGMITWPGEPGIAAAGSALRPCLALVRNLSGAHHPVQTGMRPVPGKARG
jgi:hypothetical protein